MSADSDSLEKNLEAAIALGNFQESQQLLQSILSLSNTNTYLGFCQPLARLNPLYTWGRKVQHDWDWRENGSLCSQHNHNALLLENPKSKDIRCLQEHSREFVEMPDCSERLLTRAEHIFYLIHKPGFELLSFLLIENYDKLALDNDGNCVLHIVARDSLENLFELLIFSRWIPKMMMCYNNQGFLPLHLAAWSDFKQFFHMFYSEEGRVGKPSLRKDRQCFTSKSSYLDTQKKLINQDTSDKSVNRCSNSLTYKQCMTDIDSRTKVERCSALLGCVSRHLLQIAQLLIRCGANVNLPDKNGNTCFSICVEKMTSTCDSVEKLTEIIYFCQILLKAGSKISQAQCLKGNNALASYFRFSPLHVTVHLGSVDNTKLLLSRGADLGCLEMKSKSKVPLHLALEMGHTEISLLLLDQNLYSDLEFLQNYKDCEGNTLCHLAVTGACIQRDSTNTYYSPFYSHKHDSRVFRKLHQLSCPLDKPNKRDVRPLDLAICSGNLFIVEDLLNLKPALANVNMFQDSKAYPSLHRASTSGNLSLCKLLLSYGANIEASGYETRHLLAYHRAFKFDCPDIGVFLCENSPRPFSMAERRYLEHHVSQLDTSLGQRLQHRLDNVPKLSLSCQDVIRQIFIHKYFSFQNIDFLPLPQKFIKALKYM